MAVVPVKMTKMIVSKIIIKKKPKSSCVNDKTPDSKELHCVPPN